MQNDMEQLAIITTALEGIPPEQWIDACKNETQKQFLFAIAAHFDRICNLLKGHFSGESVEHIPLEERASIEIWETFYRKLS